MGDEGVRGAGSVEGDPRGEGRAVSARTDGGAMGLAILASELSSSSLSLRMPRARRSPIACMRAAFGSEGSSWRSGCWVMARAEAGASIPLSPQPKSKTSAFSPSGCGFSFRPSWTFMRSCPRASGTLNQRHKRARARPMLPIRKHGDNPPRSPRRSASALAAPRPRHTFVYQDAQNSGFLLTETGSASKFFHRLSSAPSDSLHGARNEA